MRILINILILVAAALLIAPSFNMFLRNFTFVRPFSKLMVKYNVYDVAVHKKLVLVDFITDIILFSLTMIIAILVFIYGGTIEIIVLLIGLLISFFITMNQLSINQENIKRFCKRHYVCMDMQNFDSFIQDFIHGRVD